MLREKLWMDTGVAAASVNVSVRCAAGACSLPERNAKHTESKRLMGAVNKGEKNDLCSSLKDGQRHSGGS
jgi:hypothetical protein